MATPTWEEPAADGTQGKGPATAKAKAFPIAPKPKTSPLKRPEWTVAKKKVVQCETTQQQESVCGFRTQHRCLPARNYY